MAREITQRTLRNDSGEIMRGLDRGESYVVTRNGVPVGELTPIRRRTFVSAEALRKVLDGASARAYGRIYAAIAAGGRKARGRRVVDLLIAATAAAETLPLYTRNPDDFKGLKGIVTVVPVAR